MTLSYSETWTSTYTQAYTFTVDPGYYGVAISQPYVRRVEGNYLSGCTDSWTETPFTSNTYTSKSSNGLDWVEGLIKLCNSTTYPVPYCNGEGSHK